MFENLSALQIIIYILAGIGILYAIGKIISIVTTNRYLTRISEICMFCEMAYFQMRLSIPIEYLINRIYTIHGTINAYNYLAFTDKFIEMMDNLGDSVSEEEKKQMVTIKMLDFAIHGELDSYYKIKVFLTDDTEYYFLFEHYKNKDPKITICSKDTGVIDFSYDKRKQLVKLLYDALIKMYSYPIDATKIDCKDIAKKSLMKIRLLNLVKSNGCILFRFMPQFTEEEMKQMEENNIEKSFDKI